MGAISSWMPTLLLALALLSAGCCLSIGSEEIASSTGGQTSAGQASGGQASTGGSATAGECAGLIGPLVVVPNVIDFGPTLIDTTAKRSVMLQNCSTAAVTGITAIVLGEDANLFTVDNAPCGSRRGQLDNRRHQLQPDRSGDPVACDRSVRGVGW